MFLFFFYFLNLNVLELIGLLFFFDLVIFDFFLNICFGIGEILDILYKKDLFVVGKVILIVKLLIFFILIGFLFINKYCFDGEFCFLFKIVLNVNKIFLVVIGFLLCYFKLDFNFIVNFLLFLKFIFFVK